MRELTFFGHVFSENGVSPDPENVSAIVKCTPPTSVGEIRSFLDMTQYVARFIPHYATISEPLRQLPRKDAEWRWSEREELALNKLKEALAGGEVMAYFDPNKDTNILVDSNPVGLDAVLTQNKKTLCYASRALTDVEQRYSLTEREMLAVVYAAEQFHFYLYGEKFAITADHQPLIGIIKSLKPATARIERRRLRLMPYPYSLIYQPGKKDLMDAGTTHSCQTFLHSRRNDP